MAFDRGLVAEDVLSLIDERGLKFISALDHDQIPKVPNIDLSIFKDLDSQTALESIAHLPGFTKFDSDLYFKDFGTTGDKRYHQKRYNPSFRRIRPQNGKSRRLHDLSASYRKPSYPHL